MAITRRKKPTPVKRKRRRVSAFGKMTKASVMIAAKDAIKGLAGGAALGFLDQVPFINDLDETSKKGAKAALILVTASMLKQKEIAIGMAGAFGAELASEFGLNDGVTPYNAGYALPDSGMKPLSAGYEYDSLNDGIYPAYQSNY